MDMLIFDELDERAPDAKALALERLSQLRLQADHSAVESSLPGYGIDKPYQQSDQRDWRESRRAGVDALAREFPRKLGEEVRIILPRPDARSIARASSAPPSSTWRAGSGSRSSRAGRSMATASASCFSSKWTLENPARVPGPHASRTASTTYKIGVPWADLERRVDAATVLALCGAEPMLEVVRKRGASWAWIRKAAARRRLASRPERRRARSTSSTSPCVRAFTSSTV